MTTSTVASPTQALYLAGFMAAATVAVPGVSNFFYSAKPQLPLETTRVPLPQGQKSETAVSDDVASLIVAERAEDAAVAAVIDLMDLNEGWDGAFGSPAVPAAALDAVTFLQAAGNSAAYLEPTLHADGSVLLEINGGEDGILRFRGDGHVSYAIVGSPPGRVRLERSVAPTEILRLIVA